jgi:2-amino-4-hydroxy-6-hydroxymethyldihydropteridine diphosphokinase
MPRVYLGLGSNIDRQRNISSALAELREVFGDLTVSTVYQCPAVGFDGDDFYNLAVGLDTDLDVHEVSHQLHAIEDRHGRQRDRSHFSDRTLDIDLLLYGDLVVQEKGLALPRPEIERSVFVLKPLAEIAPEVRHPVTDTTIAELWSTFPNQGEELVPIELGNRQD